MNALAMKLFDISWARLGMQAHVPKMPDCASELDHNCQREEVLLLPSG